MPLNILILAAGGTSASLNTDDYPLCLAEVAGGASVLERIVANTKNIKDAHYSFAFLGTDCQSYHLDNIAAILVPGANVIRIPDDTKGSACTALLASANLKQDSELLIISANELVDVDLSKVIESFRIKSLDGGVLTFNSVHPRYSYVKLSDEGLVVEAAQRKPISNNATAGIFWFKLTSDFVMAVKESIQKDTRVDGKFFVAPSYNQLILAHRKIGFWPLDEDCYHPLKTDKQIQNFDHWT